MEGRQCWRLRRCPNAVRTLGVVGSSRDDTAGSESQDESAETRGLDQHFSPSGMPWSMWIGDFKVT
jgi:hypothetical protein